MKEIQRYSRNIRVVLQALMLLLPLSVVYFWAFVQTPWDFLTTTGIIQFSHDISSYTSQPLSIETRMWALVVSLLPCGVIFYALLILTKLFKSYEASEVFTVETVKYYRKLGLSFFYWAFGGLVYGGLISVVLSFNNPPGQRILSISFTGLDVVTLFCGMIVLVISYVMNEAQKIADEQRNTI